MSKALSICLLVLTCAIAMGQAFNNLGPTVTVTRDYPSLIHRIIVQVDVLNLPSNTYSREATDYTNPDDWKIETSKGKKVVIRSVATNPNNPGQIKLYTGDLPSEGKIKIQVNAKLKNSQDRQWVTHSEDDATAALVAVPVLPGKYDLTFEPTEVQDQELIDGTTKGVTHLGFDFLWPSIDLGGINGYVRSKSLLSTSNLDANSRVNLTIGVERGIGVRTGGTPKSYDGLGPSTLPATGWPVYGFLETGFVANQEFSNLSVVSTLGLRTILPVGKLLQGSKDFSRPIKLDLGIQHSNWLKHDERVDTPRDEKDMMRFTAGLQWGPLYILGNKDWNLRLHARGWYFPQKSARSGLSVSNFESVLEASLEIPIKFGDKDTGYAFRIGYNTGAQEANNFQRTASFFIGFQTRN